jgi:NADPH2 dehydrogenase
MSTASALKILQPIQIGNLQLSHRVVLSPLTRLRANEQAVPLPNLVAEYYKQRSRVPGTLVITEGVQIAAKASGYISAPGIWSKEQIDAWKKVYCLFLIYIYIFP